MKKLLDSCEKVTGNNIMPHKKYKLHSHPEMQVNLKVPDDHVIIDRDVYLYLINLHGQNIENNFKWSLKTPKEFHSEMNVKSFDYIMEQLEELVVKTPYVGEPHADFILFELIQFMQEMRQRYRRKKIEIKNKLEEL